MAVTRVNQGGISPLQRKVLTHKVFTFATEF